MFECIITDKNLMQADLERVLFDEATILRRLDEIAAQISNDYRDRELTVIAVLNGSIIFMADLLRRIPLPLKLDCLSVASYHGGTKSSGEVIFKQIALPDIAGRHILILDDILDSGLTLSPFVKNWKRQIRAAFAFVSCCKSEKLAPGRSMLITSPLKSKMNSWSVTASITWNAIAICRASVSCGKT